MKSELLECAVCGLDARLWQRVDGYVYTDCPNCDSIAIDKSAMKDVDAGCFPRDYSEAYWQEELASSRERSWGVSLARIAEAILYCRRPIDKFLDVGTGPGFVLDAINTYLPASSERFFGVEMFPPSQHSSHDGYRVGNLADLPDKFDAGICIEMVEHLTPAMLKQIAKSLADRSNDQALYLINTGLPSYVRLEDPGYIDPLRRGHIVSWGLPALRSIFEPQGFTVWALRGKSWAFCVEYRSEDVTPLADRIWTPHPQNRAMLNDGAMGSVMYLLGLETARAYG